MLAAVSPATAGTHRLHSDEMTLFRRISSQSAQQRETLTLDPILCKVARQRAADMARRNYFGHVNPDGQGANFLVRRAGFVLPVSYDSARSGNNIESLGMSIGSPNQMVALWLGSSAHRSHIMGELEFFKQQTSAGVGIVRSSRPPYYKYHVFLSAPPNAALSPRSLTLKNPHAGTPP